VLRTWPASAASWPCARATAPPPRRRWSGRWSWPRDPAGGGARRRPARAGRVAPLPGARRPGTKRPHRIAHSFRGSRRRPDVAELDERIAWLRETEATGDTAGT
jgi:hypothetical protein